MNNSETKITAVRFFVLIKNMKRKDEEKIIALMRKSFIWIFKEESFVSEFQFVSDNFFFFDILDKKKREKLLCFCIFMTTFMTLQTDTSKFFENEIIIMSNRIDAETRKKIHVWFHLGNQWTTNFVSNWIKLWSTGTSITRWSQEFCWPEGKSSWRDGDGVGGGFGCVNVNGNSTAKSLFKPKKKKKKRQIQFIYRKSKSFFFFFFSYPPIATIILTLTLYCTIIPRFSFWVVFRILNISKNIQFNQFYFILFFENNLHCWWS